MYRLFLGNTEAIPEDITVDKWFQPRENPTLRKSLSGAIMAGAFFFFDPASVPEKDRLPEWHPQTNQPQRIVSKLPRQYTGAVKPELPCMVDIVGYKAATGTGSVAPALTNLPANCLLVLTTSHDAGPTGLQDPIVSSSPSLSWTRRVEAGGASNHNVEIWTAEFAAGGNITVTVNWPEVGTDVQAAVVYALTNAELVFNTASAISQSLPSVNITGTKPDTIFFGVSADWNAQDGSSRVYRENATETLYYRPSGALTTYFFYKRGTTDQTVHTLGLTSPGSQLAATALLEIRSNCPINTEWLQPHSQPYFSKKRNYFTIGSRPDFIEPRTVLISDWFEPPSEPVRRRVERQVGWFTKLDIIADDTQLNEWFQPASIPYFSKRRDYFTGEFRFEIPREILLSDWFQEIKQPYFSKLRNYFTGEFKFELPREILLSDFFQQTSQPTQKRFLRPVGGTVLVEVIVAAEVITLDKWFMPIVQPYIKRVTRISENEYKIELQLSREFIQAIFM